MDKLNQLDILARAFLGGLVELHGREHAARVLRRLADGGGGGEGAVWPGSVRPWREPAAS